MAKVTKLLTKTYAGHTTVKFKVDNVEYSAEGHEDDMSAFERLLYVSEKKNLIPFSLPGWQKLKKHIEIKNLSKPQISPEGEQTDFFRQAVQIAMGR